LITFATFLTLIVVPAMFLILEKTKAKGIQMMRK